MDPAIAPLPPDDSIAIGELLARLKRGLPLIIGLALIGLVAGIAGGLLRNTRQSTETTMRVLFSFPGLERGQYPSGARFQVDDLRAPGLVNAAIDHLHVPAPPALADQLHGALTITPLVSPAVSKERDKLRASGQNPPAFYADEYAVTLSLPAGSALDLRQRELFLAALVNAYQENFHRTCLETPRVFRNPFPALQGVEYMEYDAILSKELRTVSAYLNHQAEQAGLFRSPTTKLSFADLAEQAEIFSTITLRDTMSLLYLKGLAKDSRSTRDKVDYSLLLLGYNEHRRLGEEAAVATILDKLLNHPSPAPARGSRQSGPAPQADTNNTSLDLFLRKNLEASLAVVSLQSDTNALQERKRHLETFASLSESERTATVAYVQSSLTNLQAAYEQLLASIDLTLRDYIAYSTGDGARISQPARLETNQHPLSLDGAAGLSLGLLLGLGLSLLNLSPRRVRS